MKDPIFKDLKKLLNSVISLKKLENINLDECR